MLDKKAKLTVAKVVKDGLCTSCGICVGGCHKQSISFLYGRERNVPLVDTTTCVDCGVCYDVCPGKGIDLQSMSEALFSDGGYANKDSFVGYFQQAYVGHSTNENIRYHCATGGMVTQFLIWLLRKNEIDGAVVVRYRRDNPYVPEPFIATTPEEIWESRSSKYIVLSMDKVSKQISEGSYKNLVVVGLPCVIQGWRQLASKNKRVRDSIKGYFAIYCSLNKTKQSIDYYLQRYHIDKQKVGRFTFRDDGCMGFMMFEDMKGEILKKIPYQNYWFGTHSFFTNPRCLSCVDQLGDLADVSFGDIHIKPFSDDKIGTNSILTRSKSWDGLLKQCKEEGAITLNVIPIELLMSSQAYAKTYKKGPGAKAYIDICKMMGRNVPSYDFEYTGGVSIKDYLSALSKYLMYEIGKRKCLWWVIKVLDSSSTN